MDRSSVATIALVARLALATPAAAADGNWTGEFWSGGIAGGVSDLIEFQGDLYAIGAFERAGPARSSGIARWDGAVWHRVGNGSACPDDECGFTRATVFDGDLVVAGSFVEVGGVPAANIARFDGVSWHPLGAGFDDRVSAVHVHDGVLFAGGPFTASGPDSIAHLGRWNGTSWEPVVDVAGSDVRAIASRFDQLVIAGDFASVDGQPAANIAIRQSDQSWASLGAGTNGPVNTLLPYSSVLVVGGDFSSAGGGAAEKVAYWEPSGWGAMSIPGAGAVSGLSRSSSGGILATGDFSNADVRYVALWSGFGWSRLVSTEQPDAPCRTSRAWQGADYVGGSLVLVGDRPAAGVVRWTGGSYEPLDRHGLEGEVLALSPFRDGLALGGGSFTANGIETNGVVTWNGAEFFVLGAGLDDDVYALAETPEGLIAGGLFEFSDSQPLRHVARWDGDRWHAMGEGLGAVVRALLWHDGALYAGGDFQLGPDASRAARWDGTQWVPLGAGPNNRIRCLASYGDLLVLGGDFVIAGRELAPRIVGWSGQGWVPLGRGLSFIPSALTTRASELWAAGSETAVWNGSDWQPGPMPPRAAASLGSRNGEVVLGLLYEPPSGDGTLRVLDGDAWEPWPAPVVGGPVRAIAGFGQGFAIGGGFRTTGDVHSEAVARWVPSELDLESLPPPRGGDGAVRIPGSDSSIARSQRYRVLDPLRLVTRSDTAELFDVSGRRVRSLSSSNTERAARVFLWDGRAEDGSNVPAGVYFLRAADSARVVKLVLVR
ncbi:MAG: hypothetical protein KC591_01440 [Gemmatimonadetes bacterium]|nr:hypothetical protein [Gemmatimonadota bacterium]